MPEITNSWRFLMFSIIHIHFLQINRQILQLRAHFGPVYALQRNPCFPKVINTICIIIMKIMIIRTIINHRTLSELFDCWRLVRQDLVGRHQRVSNHVDQVRYPPISCGPGPISSIISFGPGPPISSIFIPKIYSLYTCFDSDFLFHRNL